jgi:hypothetical protein
LTMVQNLYQPAIVGLFLGDLVIWLTQLSRFHDCGVYPRRIFFVSPPRVKSRALHVATQLMDHSAVNCRTISITRELSKLVAQ